MSGFSGTELEFRRQGIILEYWHNDSLEKRSSKLAIGVPYEILLGMLSHSNENVSRAAAFFLQLGKEHHSAVAAYLAGFISRLAAECQSSSCELEVKEEYRSTPMDFPRPSPARLLVWEFARLISQDRDMLKSVANAEGADFFFRTANR